ncbi:MAG TPA: NAD(P)/FAD-dependent oxidoreductase [Chitinophagales bacterium]|nr:NAD(P)/FAD-dependent oxidoreductase [Chitinophagales bacterium]HMV03365.1 NAD(P)/FAD-dependent oxidoreductase [Chitinophagales bacterium]HMW95055.1 NAD(P)/FAD-dependent oxidoreductase [Chitinophagales bacterium]HMY43414.1 NAD(P)/FAD-dependent oxidoreductase [Chitinophagales bacterium]HMZ69331.1 NAD(P)/FAD-dependent oxidoreductase [Chitinophagales bacterium]
MEKNTYDVIIMGAGLSGIGTAYHLQKNCKGKSYVILENRPSLGGTWDLFRYPGIRSDSDMFTLGYSFKPWNHSEPIADGGLILEYLKEAASENGIDKNIKFNTKINEAKWDSSTNTWTVTCHDNKTKKSVSYTAKYVISCLGYYNYDKGHTPKFNGVKNFKGEILHPQFWPENYDYSGKEVVIIGSGATAVTLVPAMTDKAKHVTMLQRSPTYIASIPNRSLIPQAVLKNLPERVKYDLNRAAQIGLQVSSYNLCQNQPELMKMYFRQHVKKQLPKGYDIDKHFTPKYNPWDERLCAVPNGDLFKAIRSGKAEVVTDHIDKFVEDGILLESGKKLKADIIITATGLELQMLGGIKTFIDDKEFKASDGIIYKGAMIKDVPNFAFVLGYTNSSWTLKSDMIGEYFCKLINETEKKNKKVFVVKSDKPIEKEPALNFGAGYVQRAIQAGALPSQGKEYPWKLKQNYLVDAANFKVRNIQDEFLKFV